MGQMLKEMRWWRTVSNSQCGPAGEGWWRGLWSDSTEQTLQRRRLPGLLYLWGLEPLGPLLQALQMVQKKSPAGHASRKRPVLAESKPGACKASDKRQLQKCNIQKCPTDAAKLKCNSPQDILVVLDGSESIQSSDGSAFEQAKGVVKSLVEHSSFSGDGALLRYAFVLFGASRPKLVAPMSGDKQKLLAGLDAASFQGGYSNVAEALSTAVQVSQLATAGDRQLRRETLLLITGNTLRSNVATATAARRLRAVGVRIILLQVANIKEPIVHGDETECQIASAPCADNWLRVDSWEKVSDQAQLGYYLSTICPLST